MDTSKFISVWLLKVLACCALLLALPAQANETPLVKGLCEEGKEQSGLLCYPKCKDGFHGLGPVCWQNCPAGFTDIGLLCSNLHVYAKHSYGRTAGKALWCAPGTEQNGALCYPFCRSGYYGNGPVCWSHAKKGWWIFKVPASSYGRGAGKPLSHCQPGYEKNGALCYPACKSGYKGVGPVCWANCRGGYTNDGAFCRRDNAFAKASYGRTAGKPLSLCPNYDRNTHYPIVLVHGNNGAPSFFDFGLTTKDKTFFPMATSYWGGVVKHLERGSKGNRNVFVASVSVTGTNESRGEQLRAFVDEVIKKTGRSRVHLIGHSQGAPTARYVAAVSPEKVASVTSVSGVNHSNALITTLTKWDKALDGGDPSHGVMRWAADAVALGINVVAYGKAPGSEWDSSKPLYALAEDGMKLFNWMHPWGLTDIRKGKGQNWSNPLAFVSPHDTFDGKDAEEFLDILNKGNVMENQAVLKKFLKSAKAYKDNVTFKKQQYPILYYSWGGKPPFTGSSGLNLGIFNPNFWIGNAGAPILTPFSETTMIVAASMAIADRIARDTLNAKPGDGMVDGDTARLGTMVGMYNLDHFMISNSFQANIPLSHFAGKAHPITLFCEHANRLVLAERDILKVGRNGPQKDIRYEGIKVDRYGRPFDKNGKPITSVP
jgi:pimeloyl-ACP methyl ester carboxylesterase